MGLAVLWTSVFRGAECRQAVASSDRNARVFEQPRTGIIHSIQTEHSTMNRRKKINQLLKANAKKASAKLAPRKKSTYVSKADRAKLEAEAAQDSVVPSES